MAQLSCDDREMMVGKKTQLDEERCLKDLLQQMFFICTLWNVVFSMLRPATIKKDAVVITVLNFKKKMILFKLSQQYFTKCGIIIQPALCLLILKYESTNFTFFILYKGLS